MFSATNIINMSHDILDLALLNLSQRKKGIVPSLPTLSWVYVRPYLEKHVVELNFLSSLNKECGAFVYRYLFKLRVFILRLFRRETRMK